MCKGVQDSHTFNDHVPSNVLHNHHVASNVLYSYHVASDVLYSHQVASNVLYNRTVQTAEQMYKRSVSVNATKCAHENSN